MIAKDLHTAIRILREQVSVRRKQNEVIRKRFGDRITIALTSECAYRDDEITALEAVLAEYLEPAAEAASADF